MAGSDFIYNPRGSCDDAWGAGFLCWVWMRKPIGGTCREALEGKVLPRFDSRGIFSAILCQHSGSGVERVTFLAESASFRPTHLVVSFSP